MGDAVALCEAQEATARSAELARLLGHVKTAARRWQQVWPRLRADRDFRFAVARESRLWAKRIVEASQSHEASQGH